jgi:hypothetical protein
MKLLIAYVAAAVVLAVLSIIGDVGQASPTQARDTSITQHHRTVLITPIKGQHSIIIYGLPKDARNLYACKLGRFHALYCTLNTVPIYPN